MEKPSYILCICSVNSRGSISEEIIKFNSAKISCLYNCQPFVAVKIATLLLVAEVNGEHSNAGIPFPESESVRKDVNFLYRK